ncbi:hypothetical protein [Candidatus Sororendozoicomonas aggregata]|uniref:hypothetical protein n=1 Tax=Candidatus Sororendozoicomonas aggregata TaxID=3073239 RepID=UPI002ED0B828
MPFSTGSQKGSRINFKTPLVNTRLETQNGNYSVLYAFSHIQSAYFIITRVVESEFFVITYYAFEGSNFINQNFNHYEFFWITESEPNHCLEMHIREKPFSPHFHRGLPFEFSYHLEDIAPLLNYYFSPLTDDPQKSTENFIKAIHFFQNNPMIPGIFFSDNEYAQTNGYNKNGLYPHGPYELWNDSVHPGLNHLPDPLYDLYDVYEPHCRIS